MSLNSYFGYSVFPDDAVASSPDVLNRSGDLYRSIVDAFSEVAVMSAKSADLDAILHLVVRRMSELLSIDRCAVFLRDIDEQFHGWALHEFGHDRDDEVRGFTVPPDHDGFTRALLDTKQVVVGHAPFQSVDRRKRALPWAAHPGLGVPLLFDGRVIGVVFIHSDADDEQLGPLELEIARTFSRLASFAIRHAWSMRRATMRAEVVERQRATLAQLNRAHVDLTEGFVSGASLEGLVERLVRLLRKPVTVYDDGFQVVVGRAPDSAQSTPGLPEQAIRSTWFKRQVTDLLPERTSLMMPPFLPVGLQSRRLICPLRVDGRLAGYLEVAELAQRISPTDVKVAEHGATVISLQFLTEQRARAAEERADADMRADFLDDLLRGSADESSLMRRADQFGIKLGGLYVVLLLERDTNAEPSDTWSLRQRIDLSLRDRTGVGCDASTTTSSAHLFLLGALTSPGDEALADIRTAAEAVLTELGDDGMTGFGAVSRPCQRVADYPRANRAVAKSVRLASAAGKPVAVMLPLEFGHLRVLLDGSDEREVAGFAEGLLGPVLLHDEAHDGELLPTLRIYLRNHAKIRPTAEALKVHENTIRYRLAKLSAVCAADLDQLSDLLDLRLAIQIYDSVGRPAVEGMSSIPPSRSTFDGNPPSGRNDRGRDASLSATTLVSRPGG